MTNFNGCLKRQNLYLDLPPKTAVFFSKTWEPNLIPSEEAVLELFFDPETEAYCVIPLKHLSVFLVSGQPLGTQRQYHLRRKTILSLDPTGSNEVELL
ncbi:MAG: hypothetical protein K2H85_09110 [Allobaculum sp.]|nr:hypothetical protein [Allobaculum sp.]